MDEKHPQSQAPKGPQVKHTLDDDDLARRQESAAQSAAARGRPGKEPDDAAELRARIAELEKDNVELAKKAGQKPTAKKNPTGKYVALANYKCEIKDHALAAKLKEEGAGVSEFLFDRDHPSRAGQKTNHVVLIPGNPEGPQRAYSLPEDVAEHGIALGALAPELK